MTELLGDYIRTWRARSGMTLTRAAEVIGVSKWAASDARYKEIV